MLSTALSVLGSYQFYHFRAQHAQNPRRTKCTTAINIRIKVGTTKPALPVRKTPGSSQRSAERVNVDLLCAQKPQMEDSQHNWLCHGHCDAIDIVSWYPSPGYPPECPCWKSVQSGLLKTQRHSDKSQRLFSGHKPH